MVEFTNFEVISLKNHPELNEKWLQERIADDPGILKLGDLVLKDKERPQPNSGRLDLLLQERDTTRRYEVEIQLGRCDESHIIRTIEYWDVERKRYPQYDHCAVIIAEDITGRFLNVISLFNGHIPIIALQISAIKHENHVGLVFTKVLDELNFGLVDDDEEVQEVTNRDYWLRLGATGTVKIADQLLELIQEFAPGYALNYNKHYIGLRKDGRSNNFVSFRPKKKWVQVMLKLPKGSEFDSAIEATGIDELTYDRQWGQYRLNVSAEDFAANREALRNLMKRAWEIREG